MLEFTKSKSLLISFVLGILLTAAFVYINWPFFIPFLLAGLFALALHDLIDRTSTRMRFHRKVSILIFLFLGLCIFWIPLSLAIYRALTHLGSPESLEQDHIVAQISELKIFIIAKLQLLNQSIGYDIATPARELLESVLKKAGDVFLNLSSTIISRTPALILASFVYFMTLAVFLFKADDIKSFAQKFSPFDRDLTEALITIFKKSCAVTLFSTFVIGVIQAFIIGFGSLIFGEGDFWLVLTVTFICSFIPIIGAAPMGYLLAALAFIGDRTGTAVGLALVATFAASIDNILKPFLIGRDIKLSPLIAFTSVIGAIIMIGLPGLLVGPVVMNLFLRATPLLIQTKTE
jgi:predicted PurR-regulated permease PerM